MKNKYDVIIIGGGISGLVCGCYLAKAGMKVLIIEKHSSIGGYCTSFTRKNFKFNSGVHCFCSFRAQGAMKKIYSDLELEKLVSIIRIDPSEVVYSPDQRLRIYNDIDKTIDRISNDYPSEANNVKRFFSDIANVDLVSSFVKFQKKTFKDYLDLYIKNSKLKAMLSVLVWNMWLPVSEIAALAGIVFFREFILDGGYYPLGGMQNFSNALASRFKKMGGDFILGNEVTKIIIKNMMAKGVKTNIDHIEAAHIVSSININAMCSDLLNNNASASYLYKTHKLKQCNSAFIVYLGLRDLSQDRLERCAALWYSPTLKNQRENFDIVKGKIDEQCFFVSYPSLYDKAHIKSNGKAASIICGASYMSRKFWDANKAKYAELLLSKVNKLLPHLTSNIILQEAATPATLERITSNYRGSVHGWESTVKQTSDFSVTSKSNIKNLYLAGQWVMQPIGTGGISTAAYSGMNTARTVLNQFKKA
jgi:phytoene dehydrogenase-like protein